MSTEELKSYLTGQPKGKRRVALKQVTRQPGSLVSRWQEMTASCHTLPENVIGSDLSTGIDDVEFDGAIVSIDRWTDHTFIRRIQYVLAIALSNEQRSKPAAATATEATLLKASIKGGVANWQSQLDQRAKRGTEVNFADVTAFVVMPPAIGANNAKGRLASLKMWMIPSEQSDWQYPTFHRAPGSFLLPLDEAFRNGLATIEKSFTQTLCLPFHSQVDLVWDLSTADTEGDPIPGVVGESATAAFALAAYWLLRTSAADSVAQTALDDMDVRRIGVTAGLAIRDGHPWPQLSKVAGIEAKWLGLAAWKSALLPGREVPARLLVASDQSHNMNIVHGVEHVKSNDPASEKADLRDLFVHAQTLTGENLGPHSKALWQRLRDGNPPDATDPSINHVLDELRSTNPPRGLIGYLLHRYASHATGSHVAFYVDSGDSRRAALAKVNIVLDAEADSPGSDQAPRACNNIAQMMALDEQPSAWVLTAAPGAGKTYLLCDFEQQRAQALLADPLALSARDGEHHLTAWFKLADVDTSAQDIGQHLEALWANTYTEFTFSQFLKTAAAHRLRVICLFDGINEAKGVYAEREAMLKRIAQWLDTINRKHLAAWHSASTQPLKSIPAVQALFSVRSLEAIRFSNREIGFTERTATLNAWTIADCLEYVQLRLRGKSKQKESLIAALSNQSAIVEDVAFRKLMTSPALLAAQCSLLESGWVNAPLTSAAELLSALALVMLHAEHKKGGFRRLADELLLTRDDLQRLEEKQLQTQFRPWPLLPSEGSFIPWVEALATAMQGTGTRSTAMAWGAAKGIMASAALDVNQQIKARDLAASVGWIFREGERAPTLRWTHERWRELFAARALTLDDANLPHYQALPLVPPTQAEFVEQLKDEEAVINWVTPVHEKQESLLFAVEAMEIHRAEQLIASLQRINLTLAARCALRVRSRLEGQSQYQCWDKSAELDKKYGAANETLKALRAELLRCFTKPVLNPVAPDDAASYEDIRHRHEWGLALGDLGGDPRYELREGTIEGKPVAYLRPKDEFICMVGKADEFTDYWIGDETSEDRSKDEGPLTKISLKGFTVSAFPVTNAEFRFFVEAGGYEQSQWWGGEHSDAQQWLSAFVEKRAAERKPLQPRGSEYYERDNGLQPVVGITWFEANAYAGWLHALEGASSNNHISLLTEGQWRAAAGGAGKDYGPDAKRHRRRWPYAATNGQHSPDEDPLRINFAGTRLLKPSPVGLFPRGASPEGIEDLGGNSLELTASEYKSKLKKDGLVNGQSNESDAPRWVALASGFCLGRATHCRVADRGSYDPDNDLYYYNGFRVCGLAAPIKRFVGTEP